MLREIIKPVKQSVTLQFPEEMVGKTVEVIAFEINADQNLPTKIQRLNQIEDITKATLVDLSNFRFDRDKANTYDE